MDLAHGLFQWLKTFDSVSKYRSVRELCDGVAIAQVLNQIYPEFFKNEWLNKIETDCGTNWRLRMSNLRKVYEALDDFYREELDKQLDEKLLPDVTLIGRDYNTEQLALLLQLIVGCAINSPKKEIWIERMTNLDLDVQHAIRIAIQQMDPFETESIVSLPSGPTETSVTKESALQKCADLESIVHKLNNEKDILHIQNEKLSERLKRVENELRQKDETNRGPTELPEALFQRLNNQITTLQSQLNKIEEEKEDYRLSADLSEKECIKLRQQLDQMTTRLNELKITVDDKDRLMYLEEEVARLKRKDEVHKKKNEDGKRQVQAIEARNVELTKRNCELEDENRKLSVLKGQIEIYKKQKEDLRIKVGEEGYRADRAEEESKRLSAKVEEMVQENNKYVVELSNVRHQLNQYKTNPISIENQSLLGKVDSGGFLTKPDSDSTHLKERITRLEFENEKLKEQLIASDDERVKLLESQLEDEKLRVNNLEEESRQNKQKLIKLEAEMKSAHPPSSASDDEQMETFQDIIKQKERSLESTKHELTDAQKMIADLNAVIAKKDEELKACEVKYQKHVEQAKTTLVTLSNSTLTEPSITTSDPTDVNYWKHLFQQSEQEISRMRNEFDESNHFKEMENRLMTTCFHNLSSHLQRKSAEERIRTGSLASGPPLSSFLARQRQATTRKYNLSSVPPVSQRLRTEDKYNCLYD